MPRERLPRIITEIPAIPHDEIIGQNAVLKSFPQQKNQELTKSEKRSKKQKTDLHQKKRRENP